MRKNIGFVYEWTNIINGKKYIGSHKGFVSDNYIGSGTYFRNALKKYGIENFQRKILYEGEDFKQKEEEMLKNVNAADDLNYYNLKNEAMGGTFTGEKNGMYGKKHPSPDKISTTAKKNYTEERKIKHSNDVTGKKNGMYGKNYQTRGIVNRAKENTGKTYEEIFGEEKAKKIKKQLSNSHKGKKYNLLLKICPYCNVQGRGPNMSRYHFDNCKLKNQN